VTAPSTRYRIHDRSGRLADVVRLLSVAWGHVVYRTSGGRQVACSETDWREMRPEGLAWR